MNLRAGAFPVSARKPRTLAVPLTACCAKHPDCESRDVLDPECATRA